MNQRETALNILYKTIRNESYSNLLMRNELNNLEPIQRAFVTNLVNGVLRKNESLCYQFEDETKKSVSLKTKLILCMALYERFYLNEKDYVVNNEYVELGKNKFEKSFINAILHKCTELKESDKEYIRYNQPEWLYKLLYSQYGEEKMKEINDVYQKIPQVYYRLNKNKCSYDDLKNLNISIINEDIFTCDKNLLTTSLYDEGYFYVQDYNSASLYKHLDLEKDNTLLDVCSAPGSKLFNSLDILKPENCYANDLHENRVELIRKMAEKLGFTGINYLNYDGCEISKHISIKFDRIMLDAPCSGLGVIGRKPDLKFHIKPENLDELQNIQYSLLEAMDPLLKDDGILLYSTCTLNRKENEKQIQKFLKNHDMYLLLEEDTIINEMGDCFYYAKLKKN
ncbi:MAG: hypothetical protein IK151_04005 [Erysipelotrichaceae bacterium]|nr:hypothetical protein [Erysipelotrichaceae bacterium]